MLERQSHYHAFSRSFFGAPRSTHLSLALSNATAVPRCVPLHLLLVWLPLPGPAWSADAIARENNSCLVHVCSAIIWCKKSSFTHVSLSTVLWNHNY